MNLFVVEWARSGSLLRMVEPNLEEVSSHAAALAGYYNEPTNRALMTNEHEFSAEDVALQFDTMRAEGGRPFLCFDDEALVGDCDLRNVEGRTAEFAIMVGARARQAKGLGTSFATMLVALAFEKLGLETVYASVRPENAGSLRMMEKVGFAVDASPKARRFAEEEDDVCVSIDARGFALKNAARFAAEPLRIRTREHEGA